MPSVWPWSTSIGRPAGTAGPTRPNWFATESLLLVRDHVPCSRASIAHIVLENEATVTGGNNLVGSIEAVPWQNLPNLQIVNLQHNAIDGSPARPRWLHCRRFSVLDVSGNNFGPTIPTFRRRRPIFVELDLAENLFTGSIAGIANETALTLLDLANNGSPRELSHTLASRR